MRTSGRAARWLAVAAGVAVLAAVPSVVAYLPTADVAISAPALLARIEASAARGYSGFAEAHGGLSLPVSDQFGSLANLFGGQTQLRVWWRSDNTFRVDAVTFAGENDLYRDRFGFWTWDYEANRAVYNDVDETVDVRLPQSADLLPPELGRRLLSQATSTELRRLDARSIAGHDALGLRLTPSGAQTTVGHVDVWADAATGIPLRVAAYGRAGGAVVDTTFLDFSASEPPVSRTTFEPPTGARVERVRDQLDIAGTVDRFGRVSPPGSVAGLPRNALAPNVGRVGIYGRGVTELAVAALPGRIANSLRTELGKAPGVVVGPAGALTVAVGPLTLVLGAPQSRDAAWVLVGTVTPETLATALADLPPAVGFRR